MRRLVVLIATLALVGGLTGVQPASATHTCNPATSACAPVVVAVLEGIGKICGEGGRPCTFHKDVFWNGTTLNCSTNPGTGCKNDGFYWPNVGPPARGPFTFTAGRNTTPPTSVCVSSVAGPGCLFQSDGELYPGEPVNGVQTVGAYCGSSEGIGNAVFNSGAQPGTGLNITYNTTFGWTQSVATILPLRGTVSGNGATLVGFVSARGTDGGGNCGITQSTQRFNVEGMVVFF